jgi:hypothetical protein
MTYMLERVLFSRVFVSCKLVEHVLECEFAVIGVVRVECKFAVIGVVRVA